MVQGTGSKRVYLWKEKDGGFSASEEFQNHLFDSTNSEDNVVCGFQTSEEAVPKRIKLSLEFNQQEGDVDSSEQTSPLGLRLSKTPSFINLVQMKLSQAKQSNHGSNRESSPAKMDDFVSLPMSEKLKASNFPTSFLKIGSWERISRHEGDLIAKCYYAKRKFVWEVLEGALKSKIEIQWADITAIRAVINDNEPGVLEIELNQPPLFFRENNPQPRKHTVWHQAHDFTGGQAPIFRRHHAIFPPGTLDKHYMKLLQCDNRLLMLSQKPFPSQESPYFNYDYGCADRSFDCNRCSLEIPPGLQHPVPTFSSPVVAPHHVQNFKPTTGPPLGLMDLDSPMSAMEFPCIDERARNYAFENPRTDLWGQRGNNIINNFARGDQIQGPTQVSSVLPCQDYHVMSCGEETVRPNPNTGLLGDIENHLLGDSQVVCSDELTLLARVRSMCSLLEPVQERNPNNNNSATYQLEYETEKISSDHLMVNMMMHRPRNKSLYPYAFSEPLVEDFTTLDATRH